MKLIAKTNNQFKNILLRNTEIPLHRIYSKTEEKNENNDEVHNLINSQTVQIVPKDDLSITDLMETASFDKIKYGIPSKEYLNSHEDRNTLYIEQKIAPNKPLEEFYQNYDVFFTNREIKKIEYYIHEYNLDEKKRFTFSKDLEFRYINRLPANKPLVVSNTFLPFTKLKPIEEFINNLIYNRIKNDSVFGLPIKSFTLNDCVNLGFDKNYKNVSNIPYLYLIRTPNFLRFMIEGDIGVDAYITSTLRVKAICLIFGYNMEKQEWEIAHVNDNKNIQQWAHLNFIQSEVGFKYEENNKDPLKNIVIYEGDSEVTDSVASEGGIPSVFDMFQQFTDSKIYDDENALRYLYFENILNFRSNHNDLILGDVDLFPW